jgi:alpha-glucoside transport system permease protein
MAAKEEKENKSVLVTVILLVLCLAWSLPTIGLLITSFRSRDDVNRTGWWTVVRERNFTTANYRQVLIGKDFTYVQADGTKVTARTENLVRAFLNSVTVTIPAVVIPILRDYLKLQITGTFLAIWLAHTGFGLPLAIYLLFNYVSTIPRSILESAFIDGYTHFWIFIYLILPLSMPALASFAIFQFVWVWNDLLVAMVFLGTEPSVAVLTQRLLNMIGTRGQDWHLLTAGAFVSMILPLVIFFALQRFFVRGLLAGSVKG